MSDLVWNSNMLLRLSHIDPHPLELQQILFTRHGLLVQAARVRQCLFHIASSTDCLPGLGPTLLYERSRSIRKQGQVFIASSSGFIL